MHVRKIKQSKVEASQCSWGNNKGNGNTPLLTLLNTTQYNECINKTSWLFLGLLTPDCYLLHQFAN